MGANLIVLGEERKEGRKGGKGWGVTLVVWGEEWKEDKSYR